MLKNIFYNLSKIKFNIKINTIIKSKNESNSITRNKLAKVI